MYHYGEGRPVDLRQALDLYVKFSHPEPEMSVKKFVRLKITVEIKTRAGEFHSAHILFIVCEIRLLRLERASLELIMTTFGHSVSTSGV